MTSCSAYETKDAISSFQDEITKNKKEYLYINNKILALKYSIPYSLTGYRAKQIFYVEESDNKTYTLEDKGFAHYLWTFVRREYLGIRVYENTIRYSYADVRNKNGSYYHVLYFHEPDFGINPYYLKLTEQNYTRYETGDIPKEIDGWVYHIEGNWYLESPFPKQ